MKLTAIKEEVIIKYILDLNARGYSPLLTQVQDMTNKLLVARSKDKVGKNWPISFIKRIPKL